MTVKTKTPFMTPRRFLASLASWCLIGLACAAPRASDMRAPMSLAELFAWLNLPSACVPAPEWDGRQVLFEGYLDPANIFIKRNYPQLPYEKFRVLDRHGRDIEVWLHAADNRAIGEKLTHRPSDHVVIQGRLEALNLRTASRCVQGVKVWIDENEQIQFKTN